MKKKIYSLFAIMFLLFTCVFASACGDKYKKMEFKVSYAFSENTEEWFDGTNGISLNYGGEFGDFDFESSLANIYIKVNVANVKSKHIDTITVSPYSFSNLQFSSATVKENEIFVLPISGIVDTTLNLYENNSRKSHTLKLDIYRSLEEIAVDESIRPAIVAVNNNTLDLSKVDNLIYNPYPLEQTNQTGVTYSISSIGAYDTLNRYIVSKTASEAQNFVSIEDGVLKIRNSSFLNIQNTVIRVKATSIFHNGTKDPADLVTAEFDVYVVENNVPNPVVKYVNNDGEVLNTSEITDVAHVNLYENGGTYSTASLYVDTSNLTGLYAAGVNTNDENLKLQYKTVVYVENLRGVYERYVFEDATYQSGINGLIVKSSLDNKTFDFAISNRHITKNKVIISYEIDGLDFSATKQSLNADSRIVVAKSVLPTVITVNDTVDLENGKIENAVIYGTQSNKYKGLELKLSANPFDGPERQIELEYSEGLIVSNSKRPLSENKISTGSTIYVKFKDTASGEQELVVKTLKTPTWYNGAEVEDKEYITIKYILTKVVTADSLNFVDIEGNNSSNFVVDAKQGSCVYLKVYYTGSSLNRSTVKLESDNENITFKNGSQTIALDDTNVELDSSGYDANGKFDIYQIPVNKTEEVEIGSISAVAGDGTFDVRADAEISSVYTLTIEDISNLKIETNNATVKKFEGTNNFAIAQNQQVVFEVLDGYNQNKTIRSIEFEYDSSDYISVLTLSNNEYEIIGKKPGTQQVKVKVNIYLNDEGKIVETYAEIFTNIAVFDSIANIKLYNYNNLIAYFNGYFKEAKSTEVNFEALTATSGTPQSSVTIGGETINGASQIKVSIANYNLIKEKADSLKIEYVDNDGNVTDLITNNGYILIDDENNYLLEGKIVVTLNQHIEDLKQININLKALRFGIETEIGTNITINIADVKKAERIIATSTSDNFVKLSDNKRELQMSFMKAENSTYITDSFNASVEFKDSAETVNTLKYTDISTALTYMLYIWDAEDETWERYFDDFLEVTFVGGKVNIKAFKDNGGGYFKLVLATKDSYNNAEKDPFTNDIYLEDFDTIREINIRISNGTKEAPYIIKSFAEFKTINKNLSSFFMLAADIVINEEFIIGDNNGTLTQFTGGIDGTFTTDISNTNYSITYNVNKMLSSSYGNVAGLIAIIGQNAEIKNLILNVNYADFTSTDGNGLKLGALAGVNNGTIENVVVQLSAADSISFNGVTAGSVDFGGIVGLNNTNAEIKSSRVIFDKGLTISSNSKQAHNIGLVAGTNKGEIIGAYAYENKKGLNNVVFDVISNLTINNTQQDNQVTYNIGGVAGVNTNKIETILIGGKITVTEEINNKTTGNLAGIAASSNGGIIQNLVVMSLNLDATDAQSVKVAGVAGETTAEIVNAKYVSAITKFAIIGDCLGQISGSKVAGIAVNATSGTITNSSVESFVDTIDDETTGDKITFNTLDGTTIYGISNIGGTNCFVNANVSKEIEDDNLISYFIGKINDNLKIIYTTDKTPTFTNYYTSVTIDASSDLTNVYYLDDNGKFVKAEEFIDGKTYIEFNKADWETYAKGLVVSGTWTDNKNGNWRLEENHNFIYVNGVKFYFPYLVNADEEAIMIVAPQSIKANINEGYNIVIDSTYVISYNPADYLYRVKEFAVVNYFAGASDEDNAHKLISDKGTTNGLLNAEILPNDAQGGYDYLILGDGTHYAYINSSAQIVFKAASGQIPIILQIKSKFNEDIVIYVAFYSVFGVTDLGLSSTSTYKVNAGIYDYETSLYTGQNNKVLAITAENVKNDKSYSTLLNSYNIDSYLKVEVSKITNNEGNVLTPTNSKLDISAASYKNMSLKIKEDETVSVGYYEIVEFTLYLDKTYFTTFDFNENDKIIVGSIKLLVRLYNSATQIELVGVDKEISSFDDVNFDVYLTTDWTKDSLSTTIMQTEVDGEGNIILKNDADNDSIKIALNIVQGSSEVTRLIDQINDAKGVITVSKFADLFKVDVIKNFYEDAEENTIGYTYNVTLELIDDHDYRYIIENIKFNVIVYAVSNLECNNLNSPMEVVLKPTSVSTARMESYAVNSLRVNSTYTDILESSDVTTSIVQPGGLGNIMMIYLQPTYSNVVSAKIKSSSLFVPSLNKNVQMKFTQLVYNEQKDAFTTLFGSKYEQVDDTLQLQLTSTIDSLGREIYTGIILIHIQLEQFAGLEDTIKATLEVETNNGQVITRTRSLLTTYLPGTEMQYDETKKVAEDSYLIQKGTSNNEVKIKIYGYQFSSNPGISFDWDLPALKDANGNPIKDGEGNIIYGYKVTEGGYDGEIDGVKYKLWEYQYVDGNIQKIQKTGENALLIGNYVSYYLLNSYNEVEYNSSDDSYTLTLKLNVAEDIPAAFRVNASLNLSTKDGQLETASDTLIFHPTEYIINSIYVDNLVNNKKHIAVNKTSSIDIKFVTDNKNKDLSDVIYEKLNRTLNIPELFKYYRNGSDYDFADIMAEFEVNMVNNKILSITGVSKYTALITLAIDYQYKLTSNGLYELEFGVNQRGQTFTFTLEIYISDEENETPIYSADQIYNSSTKTWNLIEGGYYVLMNDIELESVVPITTKIGRFDGNNRTISIKSFATNVANGEYGLFANIGEYIAVDTTTGLETTKQTILQNIIVDYSKFEDISVVGDTSQNITFGGLVANNNNGIIYNCDVMNLDATKDKEINIIVGKNSNVIFGGLVGNNNGVITNSRVGREGYTRITATKTTQSETYKYAKGLTFRIYNESREAKEGEDLNQFSVVAGAFVGENEGTIASSYSTRTNLINYSLNEKENKTAGFVGQNSGKISYSYVKADESTISSTTPRSTGYVIESKGNGILAGFVYTNSGEINNSYANTELTTTSAYISGFVYENSGEITECYAACTMNSGSDNDNVAEQPFIGVNEAEVLMNTAKIENSYYLMRSNVDTPYYYEDRDVAQGLNAENFQNSEYLINFVFVLTNSKQERDEGIWSYYTLDNQYRILPELMNTNTIAHSYRYVIDDTATTKAFTNAVSYAQGSKNNPYTISNVRDYNNVFAENNSTSQTGYIRFINNIDFNNDEVAIKTRSNYTLGNKGNYTTITSVEGNGMTIKGIYLDVGQAIVEKIGLFASIENAYVKNLNLDFATPTTNGQFSTTTVQYSGGLAGTINNSVIVNVKLNGNNTTLTGNNFVGGLAGKITGTSLIFGVESNLNVKAMASSANLYYNEADYNNLNKRLSTHMDYATYSKTLSYAGGVAGVIDLTSRTGVDYNVQFIDVRGDLMSSKTFDGKQEANILAEYAGGVAGYSNKQTNSFKLRYFTGKNELIRGNTAVGGLYAVALGSITASQVTADEDIQFTYDTKLGNYVLGLRDNTKNLILDTDNIGNSQLLEGYGYVGGLVGIGLDANIRSSYAKVGIKNAATAGGLIGTSVASSVKYSYAIPFVSKTALETSNLTVGGLFGSAYRVDLVMSDRNRSIEEYDTLLKYQGLKKDTTDIMFTYSSLLLDDASVVDTNDKLDYLAADYLDNEKSCLTSSGNEAFTYVYIGPVDYKYATVVKNTQASTVEISKLFDVENPEQSINFQEVFSGWQAEPYWSLREEKYFPLLNDLAADNFIDIDSEDDFKQLSDSNGKFRVIKDITIPVQTANWVVSGTFSGVLVGQIPGQDRAPKITIQGLTPNQENSTGFFRETKGATISNLNIVWNNNAITLNTDVTMVSGLTCDDDGSLISNVEVRATGDGYIVNDPDNTITGFGGIVGYSKNTNILGCKFVGKVDATLVADAENTSYVGGIIAKAETILPAEEGTGATGSGKNTTAVINSSFVGADAEQHPEYSDIEYPTTAFTLDVESETKAYIGGIVGYAENVAIASSSIGSYRRVNEDGYQLVDITVKLNDVNQHTYIGGATGYSNDGTILNCDTLTKITVTGTAVTRTEESETVGQNVNIGGLSGYYALAADKTSSGIDSNNSKSYISTYVSSDNMLTLSDPHQLRISTGVAELATNATMEQCLFIGEINTENSNIENVYAGGAVALVNASTGSISIKEVTTYSTLIVGTSETTSIYAGGLVGWLDNATISYCSSLGRVVPITSEDATNIYGGGLIGKVGKDKETTHNVSINNSYTISTIIADSIAGTALKNLNMGALIGGFAKNNEGTEVVNATVANTYYSSDYALFADENYLSDGNSLGTNISTATMLLQNVWVKNKNYSLNYEEQNVSIWEQTGNINCNIPYLSSLKADLINYGILVGGDYVEGTPMRPKNISSNTTLIYDIETTPYTYYFYEDGKISGDLYGVLIAKDATFELSNGNIIEKITKHSAVSNLHVKLNSGTINLTNGTGVIATTNNGVIANCSVIGSGITITGASAIGLIANENTGLISYSYSTAEIVSSSAVIGGIVHTNNDGGKLLSNYFTGYINNPGSAGIVAKFNGGYAYNNYMAGVIDDITISGSTVTRKSNPTNNFVNQGTLIGVNNYIDKYSDLTYYYQTSKTEGLDSVETLNLMKSGRLTGEWYFTMDADGYVIDDASTPLVNESPTYGYNYNYPVYKFNKMVYGASNTLEQYDTYYQLDTGNGVTGIEDNGEVNKTRYEGVISVGDAYTNAFKIPHLGVLSTLSSLADKNLNYVVIYDLDGQRVQDNLTDRDWSAISGDFKGLFVSNRYYDNNATETKICSISNLSGKGLFANVINMYFGDINLGSFYNLKQSGPLGNIGKPEAAAIAEPATDKKVYVNNVKFLNGSTVSGVATYLAVDGITNLPNYYGGLFGSIETGYELTVSKFNTAHGTSDMSVDLTLTSTGATVGLIAGKSSGYITLSSANSTYYALFNGNGYAGGVVGEMAGGTIDGGNATINIVPNKDFETTTFIGGAVGKTTGESEREISNITIAFVSLISTDGTAEYKAESFGGIVGEVGAVTTIDTDVKLKVPSGQNIIKIQTSGENNYYGLIAGLQSADLTVNSFAVDDNKVKFIIENGSNYDADSDKTGVGTFIGSQSAKLEITNYTPFEIELDITGVPNIGGISGLYQGGDVLLKELPIKDSKPAITLKGTTNVGGLFGYVPAEKTLGTLTANSKSILQENKFTTIYVGKSIGEKQNFGGLFGKCLIDLTGAVNNQNNIIITAGDAAYNIGGVAGSFSGSNANNLTNSGDIKYDTTIAECSAEQISNKKSDNEICSTVNVGGIFGYVASGTFENLINQANVAGYQNVGGLIGYVNGGTLSNPASIGTDLYWDSDIKGNFIDGTELVVAAEENKVITGNIYGVLNVGGAVGYAGEITISQIYSNANVYGNTSVGGLIGYAKGTTVTDTYITPNVDATKGDAIVKGVYYNYNYKENVGGRDEDKTASYIPTSVGGLIGSNKASTLNNNILNGVKITSTDEGTNDGDVISTIDNYMVDFAVGDENADITSSTEVYVLDAYTEKTEFNDITTGFGGFIGSTNTEYDNTNVMNSISISAQLGVNVGTYYGVLSGRAESVSSNISFPQLVGSTNVDGAYNIGGLIGFINGNASNITNNGLPGGGTINLQSNFTGMYVGGLIGKTNDDNISGLQITSNGTPKIIINTDKSYYIGGLIGRAEVSNATIQGNVGNWTIDNKETPEDPSDDDTIITEDTDSIVTGDDKSNFGGLIGMLKVASSGGETGYNITVSGNHKFAFTINTVENSNYYDGSSSFNANENKGDIELFAQAYYINLDKLTVSASKGNYTKNPLDGTVYGWAPDYTMFRQVQRCIPKHINSNKWEAISVIYDAINIKGVVYDDDNKKITSTVYEEEQGSPNVYTEEGIYFALLDKNGFITGAPECENGRVEAALKAKGYYYKNNREIDGENGPYPMDSYLATFNYCGTDYVFLKEINYNTNANSGSIFEVTGTGNNLWGKTVKIDEEKNTKIGSKHELHTASKGNKIWDWIKTIFNFVDYSDVDNFWDGALRTVFWPYNLGKNIENLIEIYEVENMDRNEVAEKFFIANQTQSYGVLSNMYSREIKYYKDISGNWYVDYGSDDIITYQGFEFNTYQKTKPADFIQNRFVLMKLTEGTSGEIIYANKNYTLNKSDEEERPTPIPISTKLTTIGKSNFGWNIVQKEGDATTYYLCVDYYLYYQGQYWINTKCVANSTPMLSNNFFEVPTDSEGSNTYLQNENGNYVYGTYNLENCSYSFKTMNNNYIIENNKSEAKVYYDVGENITIQSNVTATQEVSFTFLASGGVGIEGYDYMQNAIYSTTGVKNMDSDYNETNGVQELVKYGDFKYVGDNNSDEANKAISGLKENYQYVIKTYYYNKTITNADGTTSIFVDNKQGVFVLQEENDSATKENTFALGNSSKAETVTTDTTITLAMYPATFNKTQFSSGTTVSDSNSYQAGVSDNGVKHEVEYFLWIGGFKVRDDDSDDQKLNVYISTDEVVENMENLYYDKNNNNSYDEGDGDLKYSDVYMKVDEKMYKLSEYYIPTVANKDMVGRLCKDYLTFIKNPTEKDSRYGKYCSDSTYNLYTRYKYTGLTETNSDGNPRFKYDDKHYYIIPKNGKTGSPNTNRTVFVEVVKVCFGAKNYESGVEVTAGNGNKISGYFYCNK